MDGYRRNRLPFPYSYTTRDVFDNDVTVGDVPPHEPNDCNLLIAQLTDDVLFKLTSAMQAGLDLIYPDEWQTLMDWWAYAVALSNTGTFVSCEGDEILDICDIVADCIRNSTNVQDAINEVVKVTPETGNEPVPALPAQTDELDCVWGASFGTFEIVLDGWASLKVILESGAEFTDIIAPLSEKLGWLTPRQLEIAELLFSTALTAADAYMNLQSTQDDWACALFNCITSGGRPYTVTNACLREAFATLDPFGVLDEDASFVELLFVAAGPNTLKSYWNRLSDDECNNDWETVCAPGCGDPEPTIEFFGDARIFEITANGVPISVSPTQQAFALSGGWSPLVVKFDRPVCLQSIRSRCNRPVTANRPNAFDVEFGSYSNTVAIGGVSGAQDFVINPNGAIGDTLVLTAPTAADNVAWAWQLVNIANPGIFVNEIT